VKVPALVRGSRGPAKGEHSSTVEADLAVRSGRGKALQKPRSTNTKDGDEVTVF